MSVAVAALCGVAIWTAVAFPVAVAVGRAIHHADPGEDGPDGTVGDLLADQPPEVLTVDEAFHALTDPLEAERDARPRGRVIRP